MKEMMIETTQEKIPEVEIMTMVILTGEIQEMVIKEIREIITMIILTGGEVETTQAKILEVILFEIMMNSFSI